MNPFADAADFESRMGVTLVGVETSNIPALLARASDRIREFVDQDISLVADDVYTRPGTIERRILLPQRPVVSVASVELDGVPISDWYLAGDALVRSGLLAVDIVLSDLPYGRGFGYEAQTLTITYTHGYGTIPQICQDIAIEMVARVWVNPGSVVRENIAGVFTEYSTRTGGPPRGLALTDDEKADLRRVFGTTPGSTWIGG